MLNPDQLSPLDFSINKYGIIGDRLFVPKQFVPTLSKCIYFLTLHAKFAIYTINMYHHANNCNDGNTECDGVGVYPLL